jgi:indolepyruvate ferredoxin oxidoreductase
VPQLTKPFNMLVTGIGGTGVLTVGQVLGMAAFLEGKGLTILDMSAWRRRTAA